VKWENRPGAAQAMLAGASLSVAPFAAGLWGVALLAGERGAAFRQTTGYFTLGLVALAVLLGQRRWPLRRAQLRRQPLHMLLGLLPLAALLVHTGGRWGHNFNGWLLGVLLAAVFAALLGKLVENRLLARAAVAGGSAANPPLGPGSWRRLWLSVHLVLVAAALVLVGFHVFTVYYF
jgi:nitrite reductase (NADH) large subunit